MTDVKGELGQAFESSTAQEFVNANANKLSAYVKRLERGRFVVRADGSLGDAFKSYTRCLPCRTR